MKAWGILDLRTINGQWRTAKGNVWYVEDALRNIRHKKIHTSKSTVQKWRKKFLAFKQRNPDRQPNYYPYQAAWM